MLHYSVVNDRDTLNTILDTFNFWIASNPEALVRMSLDATIEAEFGDRCVVGKLHTLAHHGSRAANACPCEIEITPIPDWSNVGLSHVDLDAIGGCLRLAGYGPFEELPEYFFWKLAANIDTRGYHKLSTILKELSEDGCGVTEKDLSCITRYYHAWCVWSAKNRYYPPRHADAVNCTGFVHSAINIIMDILLGDEVLLQEGDKWLAKQETLEKESFRNIITFPNFTLIVRSHAQFTNLLYTTFLHGAADLVFAHNLTSGACTLSKADEDFPVDCAEVMKKIFGPNAGGRAAIAGSPRGVKYIEKEFSEALDQLIKIIEN